MNNAYIFVYGTLRRDTNSEIHHLLAKYAEFIDEATCLGKLYKAGYYPGMVPSDNSKDIVYGEVYLLHRTDIVLPLLDQYEEFGREFPEPNEYSRQRQTVFLKNGNIVTAWIYIYNHPTEGLELIEPADFLKSSLKMIDFVTHPPCNPKKSSWNAFETIMLRIIAGFLNLLSLALSHSKRD